MNIFDLQATIGLNGDAFMDGVGQAQTAFEGLGSSVKQHSEAIKKGLLVLGSAAVAAGGAVVKSTVDAAYAADDLNTLSKQTGIATDTLQKFKYASDLIDVSMDTLTGSLTKLTRNMNTAREGTGDAAKAFDALGIAFVDAEGNLRDREDVFDEVIAALGDIENVTERDALAMSIFGRSAQELNPLIMGGADALKELGKQAEDAGLILSQDALDGLNQLSDALDTAKATTTSFTNVFGTAFAPAIASAINEVTRFGQEVTRAFSEGFNTDGISGALSSVGAVFSAKLSEIASDVSEKVPEMTRPIEEFVSAFDSVTNGAITGFVEEVASFAGTVASVSADVLESVAGSVRNFISAFDESDVGEFIGKIAKNAAELFTAFTIVEASMIQDIAAGIKAFLDNMDETEIADSISTVAQVVGDLFGEFTESAAQTIKDVSESLNGFFEKAGEGAANIPENLAGIAEELAIFIGKLGEVSAKIEEFVGPIRSFFGGTFLQLISSSILGAISFIDHFTAAIERFLSSFNHATDSIKHAFEGDWHGVLNDLLNYTWDVVNGITEAFASLVEPLVKAADDFFSAGEGLISGFWNGLKSKWDSVTSGMAEKASGLTSLVMGLFKEHSPSKVFAGIGANLILGLAEGWGDEYGRLLDTVSHDMTALTGTAKVGFESSALGRSSAAQINSFMAGQSSGGTMEINLVLDGDVAATALYDPLRRVAWQKGKGEPAYA